MLDILSTTGTEPVSANEAAAAARLDGDAQTELAGYIDGAITAARQVAEQITGRRYIETVQRWSGVDWPAASATGVMLCQRLRARTEHDHLNAPGRTRVTARPSLLARMVYLPHHTWMHAEHHADPACRVWVNPWPEAFTQNGVNQ